MGGRLGRQVVAEDGSVVVVGVEVEVVRDEGGVRVGGCGAVGGDGRAEAEGVGRGAYESIALFEGEGQLAKVF